MLEQEIYDNMKIGDIVVHTRDQYLLDDGFGSLNNDYGSRIGALSIGAKYRIVNKKPAVYSQGGYIIDVERVPYTLRRHREYGIGWFVPHKLSNKERMEERRKQLCTNSN